MRSDSEKFYCPIREMELDIYECLEICMVAEGISPRNELPIGFDLTEERQRICMTCKEHPDLD